MKRSSIVFTEKASQFIRMLCSTNGELVMFIGSGCCDGPTPQIFKKAETVIPPLHELVDRHYCLSIYFIAPITYNPKLHYIIDLHTNVINDSFSIESRYDSQLVLQIKKYDRGENHVY